MHKEVLVAIIFGSLLGLVVAFGVWRANGAIQEEAQKLTQANDDKKDTSEDASTNNLSLTLSQPEDRSVALSNPLPVAGITHSENLIAISTNETDYFLFADAKGEFSQDINLTGGLNEIKVFSFAENGTLSNATALVGYSSEFSSTDEEINEATSEGAIQEKIDKKLADRARSPKMYLGTTTDITETGIQLKDEDGTIRQLSINKDEASFANIVSTEKTIAFSDVAIGDYVIALGFTNGKEILAAERILVATPFKPTSRTSLYGIVQTKAAREITLTTNDKDFKIPTNTKGLTVSVLREGVSMKSTLNTLGEGDTVIVVGTPDGDTFTPRKIFIVKKAS